MSTALDMPKLVYRTRDFTRTLSTVLFCLVFCSMDSMAQIPEDGLQVWLRASDLMHLSTGAKVAVWPDSSGHGHHASGPNASQPVFIRNAVNGLPAVRFNGTSGFLSTGAYLDIPVQTGSGVTAFVVASNRRSTLTRNTVDVLLASKVSGESTGFGLSTFNAYADPTLSFRALGAERAGSGSSVLLRKNGSASSALALNEYAILGYLGSGISNGGGGGQSVRIGGFAQQSAGLYGRNDIAEVLIYDRRLSASEVFAVEAALAERYGLPNAAEPIPAPGERPYRGAEVRTAETFTYGRFEVRMRSMQASGVLASFFTYAEVSADRWNEIDIEIMGRYVNEVQFNAITPGPSHHTVRHEIPFNPHLDYHTYAFEWTPAYVAWFVDGVEAVRQTGGHVATLERPQKLMMNVWQPEYLDWAGAFESSVLPACASYDQVSYAAYTPGSGSAGTGDDFTPLWTDDFETFDRTRWQRATHTFEGNNVQFVTPNAGVVDGSLVLCITRPDQLGYTPTALDEEGAAAAGGSLFSYPNPFDTHAKITFELPVSTHTRLVVYDLLGREVSVLLDGVLARGTHEAELDARALRPGLYLYRLSTDAGTRTGRMLLVR